MKAKFIRLTESGKHALCIVREKYCGNGGTPVYIPTEDLDEEEMNGETFNIPDTLSIVDLYRFNQETEKMEVATVEINGETVTLKTLARI